METAFACYNPLKDNISNVEIIEPIRKLTKNYKIKSIGKVHINVYIASYDPSFDKIDEVRNTLITILKNFYSTVVAFDYNTLFGDINNDLDKDFKASFKNFIKFNEIPNPEIVDAPKKNFKRKEKSNINKKKRSPF